MSAQTSSRRIDGAADLDRPDVARAGLRTFFNIAKAWGLSEKEQMAILGLAARSTFQSWKAGTVGRIGRDALERLSYVFGIYKALHILLPARDQADAWVRRPNAHPLFAGRPAIERMTSGNVADLFVVRQYLDAQRG